MHFFFFFLNSIYVSELQNEKNVKYLNISDIINKNRLQKSYYFNSQYISSKLFYSSIVEYIMAKVYNMILSYVILVNIKESLNILQFLIIIFYFLMSVHV